MTSAIEAADQKLGELMLAALAAAALVAGQVCGSLSWADRWDVGATR
jgi:hypothetical protein